MKTNSHSLQGNGVQHWEYWQYNTVHCFWNSLNTQEKSGDFFLLVWGSLWVWFYFDWSESFSKMPQLELCPIPVPSQMGTATFLAVPPAPYHQLSIWCHWSVRIGKFWWPKGKTIINAVGFPLGWCWVTKDSFINLFINQGNWERSLDCKKTVLDVHGLNSDPALLHCWYVVSFKYFGVLWVSRHLFLSLPN